MTAFLNNAFSVCLGTTALILLMLLIKPFFTRRYTAKWRYLVLVVLALRLLIPVSPALLGQPKLQLTMPEHTVRLDMAPLQSWAKKVSDPQKTNTPHFVLPDRQPANQNQSDAVQAETASDEAEQSYQDAAVQPSQDGLVTSSNAIIAQQGTQSPNSVTMLFTQLLGLLWIFGAVFCVCSGTVGYLLARRSILKKSLPMIELQPTCRELCSSLGIKRPIPIRQSAKAAGPMLLGIIKPVIVLPGLPQNNDELAVILRHELEHHRRKDVAGKLIFSLVCWLYWFNPAVWLLRSAAEAEMEQACDEAVIKGQDSAFRVIYSQSIVHALHSGRYIAGSTAFSGTKKTIHHRIVQIFNTDKKKAGKISLAVVVCLALLAGTLVACQSTAAAQPEDTALITAEVPAQAMQLVNWGETFLHGEDWPQENSDAADNAANMAWMVTVGLLDETGEIKNMLAQPTDVMPDPDYYEIPTELQQELLQFFAYTENPFDESLLYKILLTVDYTKGSVDLTLTNIEKTEDGSRLILQFSRSKNGVESYLPVTYTLHKTTVETVPELLSEEYAPGDELWQIEKIENGEYVSPYEPQTIEISTAEQLIAFCEEYNQNGWKYEQNTYLLTADIDLSDTEFIPIGARTENTVETDSRAATYSGFNAVFDGQGHTITGLVIDGETVPKEGWLGFFSHIGPFGVVKNLNINDAKVFGSQNHEIVQANGILAGRISGQVENCHVTGTVKGIYSVGGLAGEAATYYRYTNAAGERSFPICTISDCTADVTVSGSQSIGGMLGSAVDTTILRSTAKGMVEGLPGDDSNNAFTYPACVGGFAGFTAYTQFKDCTVDSSLVIRSSGDWIGYALGNSDGEGAHAVNFAYNSYKKGNWQLIDVINGIDATTESMQPFEFVAMP